MAELGKWGNFFMIVGPSGAALIGVQFVVVALIANTRGRTTIESISAFGTPTVVHLGGALFISAVLSAPWPSLFPACVTLALCGLCGLGYGATVVRCARRQTSYKPVREDWLWYTVVPCSLYATLVLAALFLCSSSQLALFVIGGTALGLLLVGIHNAWDSITHIVVNSESNATDGR